MINYFIGLTPPTERIKQARPQPISRCYLSYSLGEGWKQKQKAEGRGTLASP